MRPRRTFTMFCSCRMRDIAVTVGVVFGAGSKERTKDNGLGFVNLRSELWWRFREALDPGHRRRGRAAARPAPCRPALGPHLETARRQDPDRVQGRHPGARPRSLVPSGPVWNPPEWAITAAPSGAPAWFTARLAQSGFFAGSLCAAPGFSRDVEAGHGDEYSDRAQYGVAVVL
jgi:hypothetical protein